MKAFRLVLRSRGVLKAKRRCSSFRTRVGRIPEPRAQNLVSRANRNLCAPNRKPFVTTNRIAPPSPSFPAQTKRKKRSYLCSSRISRKQPPVDVRPVPHVGRVAVLGRRLENLLDDRLTLVGLLEEELDDGRQRLELDLVNQSKC